jgi:hypothetical protein
MLRLMFSVLRMLLFAATVTSSTATVNRRASAKAFSTQARLDYLLNNGGSFGGDVHVVGNHYTTGQSHHGSITTSGDVIMNGHNMANLGEINTGHQTWGAHGDFYMNGYNIHMQGGSVLSDA